MLSSTDMVVWQMDIECRPAMGSPWNKFPPICSACCQRDSEGLHLCTSCWHDPPQANNWYPYLWGMPDSFPCFFFPVRFKFQPVYWVWYIRLAPGINTGIITGSKDPTRLVRPEAIPGSISGAVNGITRRRAPNEVGAKPWAMLLVIPLTEGLTGHKAWCQIKKYALKKLDIPHKDQNSLQKNWRHWCSLDVRFCFRRCPPSREMSRLLYEPCTYVS